MRVLRITSNLPVADIEAATSVYTDFLAAYDEARSAGYEIVHPVTVEPWGVHRFFVRAPDGNVFNIVEHPNQD